MKNQFKMNTKGQVQVEAMKIDIHDLVERLIQEGKPLVLFFGVEGTLGMVSTVSICENIKKDIKEFLEELPEIH